MFATRLQISSHVWFSALQKNRNKSWQQTKQYLPKHAWTDLEEKSASSNEVFYLVFEPFVCLFWQCRKWLHVCLLLQTMFQIFNIFGTHETPEHDVSCKVIKPDSAEWNANINSIFSVLRWRDCRLNYANPQKNKTVSSLFSHSNFCWERKHNWNFSQTRLKNVSALKDDNLVIFMTVNLNCSASSYRCKLIFTIKERKLWMWREAIKSSIGKYKQGQGTMECFPAIQQKHRNNQSLRFIENTPQLQVHCEFKIKATLKQVIQKFLKVFHLHRFCPKMPHGTWWDTEEILKN